LSRPLPLPGGGFSFCLTEKEKKKRETEKLKKIFERLPDVFAPKILCLCIAYYPEKRYITFQRINLVRYIFMIEVHRLNGELFLLNSDMIETMDTTPDTVIRLVNGHRYIVKEKANDVKKAVIEFRRLAGYSCIPLSSQTGDEEA
jgi:flagellar protein FlbD